MTKILLVQGANLTFLGRREPAIYGTTTAAELDAMLQLHARKHDYVLDIRGRSHSGRGPNGSALKHHQPQLRLPLTLRLRHNL